MKSTEIGSSSGQWRFDDDHALVLNVYLNEVGIGPDGMISQILAGPNVNDVDQYQIPNRPQLTFIAEMTDTSIMLKDNAAALPQDVADLVRHRQQHGRGDGFKLGLAVEGGGMRGIVSGAMVLALKELDLLDAFDSFYGTSSGAMNLAYVIGGSSWEGMAVYYDHLSHDFVKPRPWRLSQPLVDMDYGFDEVMGKILPIGWDTVRAADRPLFTVLTDVDRVESKLIDMRTLRDDPISYAKAASWMPMVAGPPPVLDGTRYLDGVLLCPDPVYAALVDGCTHVLLCHSWPQGKVPASPRSRLLLRPLLNRWQPGLGEAYVASRIRWDKDRAHARFGTDDTIDGATVLRLASAEGSHRVSQLTTRRDVLLDGARAGYRTIMDVFGSGQQPYFVLGS